MPLMFQESKGYLVRSLRDRYRTILQELGVTDPHSYTSQNLKIKLLNHYGKHISVIDETCSSGFICPSDVRLGDALEKMRKLEKQSSLDKRQDTVLRAAKIIREDAKTCKKQNKFRGSIELSTSAASRLVPDSIFNFSACVLTVKTTLTPNLSRVKVDSDTAKKASLMSQYILQQITGMQTPLSIATAHHLYNETRSKSLVTLNNKLGQGISYNSLHRQVENYGVFIPENISTASELPHVFALDNLDWRKKTLDGGSFHATTAIVIDNQSSVSSNTTTCVPSSSSTRRQSLGNVPEKPMSHINITQKERQKSRSLESIPSLESLQTDCNGIANDLLLIWKVARISSVSPTVLDIARPEETMPGFSAFCSRVLPLKEASKIGYFPLLPDTPTNAIVLQEQMKRLIKASQTLGNEWIIIAGDQATYELARVIRDKNQDGIFDKVILLLGGFQTRQRS